MRLLELKNKKVIVVYGGGFQPFHAGHMSSYLEAKKAFPGADFYVAASNVTSERPIPFNEKKFLAQQAGVRDPFVQVGTMSYVNDNGRKVTSTPLNPLEVLKNYNPEEDVLVIVRSERDPMKTTATSYYQPFTDAESASGFGEHAYIYVTKKHDFDVGGQGVYSGSQVRELYANADNAQRQEIIGQLYPGASNPGKIKQILDKRIGGVQESANPVRSTEKAKTVSPVLGKDPKQHPFKGRLVGEEAVQEKAPPGMETWIKHRKADFKKRYGDRWKEVLYATAWKRKNNESIGESVEDLDIGDPVIITGNVNLKGTTGDIIAFGQDKRFVIVDLYNHGKHSFHASDVSYNDYAGSDAEEARMYDAGGFREGIVR